MNKSLIAAVVFATASFGSSAVMAQSTVGKTPQVVDLTDNTAFFGDTFNAGNNGASFADRFTFSVSSTSGPMNLDAIVSSISRTVDTGLNITGLSLYSATGNTLVTSGSSLQSGATDVWTVSSSNLAAGDYYLQVSGNLASGQGASFGGAVALAPVPEPETYGMMLGGLGVLGFLARRRKASKQA